MSYASILLTGDYVGSHKRQLQAFNEQCLCVVEFHFNSAPANAQGGEVHHKIVDDGSREFAEAMWAEFAAIGLPAHGSQPVKSTSQSPRSGWIDHYAMLAIVLEPLFISNDDQADWLHSNSGTLADAIAVGIRGFFPNGGRIGLSAGHAGKSTPDQGSACSLGDYEADHTVAMRDLVKERLDK